MFKILFSTSKDCTTTKCEPTRLLPPSLSLYCVQEFGALFEPFFNELCNILAKN